MKESSQNVYKIILPAFEEFVEALDVVSSKPEVWEQQDLTFMILKARLYLQGAVAELEKLTSKFPNSEVN